MTKQQRNNIENAIDIISGILEDQQEKQSNLECAYMDHLPIYDTISDEVELLENCHDAMTTLADELQIF